MRRALGAHRRDFVAIVGLVVAALLIAGYILYHQPAFNFNQSYYTVQAQFANSAAVTPGQGQAVTIAGVQVGQVGGVKLQNGRAVVTMNIYRRYSPIYRDATVLLRPRTPLKDMYLALDPGTSRAGAIPEGGTLSAGATAPTVDLGQILASLDADTRSYLLLLLSGGAQAFRDPAGASPAAEAQALEASATPGAAAPSPAAVAALRATFKRFAPLERDTRTFATLLAARNQNLREAIHNLQRVATALGGVDGQLASLISASNANFSAISSQDANLEAGLTLLPGALTQTDTTLGKVQRFSAQIGPALGQLLPFAHALGPALSASRPLFHDTTPVIQNQLRPFSTAVQPVARALRPAATKLAQATPPLTRSVGVLNTLFNTLAYQPRAGEQGYLFWGSWLAHNASSLTDLQDAHGATVRGIFMATCPALNLLETTIQAGSPSIGPLLDLLNAPDWSQIKSPYCPAKLGALSRQAPSHLRGERMNKQAPSAARILTMVAFAASCIGLLLFLWISFGGTTSLGPRGYEISAEFDQAVDLGSQADVRISGVTVGKVVSVGLDRRTGLTKAVMEIDPQFAPRPADTRAILRQKTLLGETYVELSPGSANDRKLPDGGALPQAQVAPSVQLDEILSTFDPATRRAFQVWMQQEGTALTGRGENLNAALAELYPFATNVDSVLAVLNRDSAATSTLLRDGGQVFSAIAHSPAALQQLIDNSNAAFSATNAQAAALARTIKAFPPFLVAQKSTIDRLRQFSITTKPLVDELRPAAVQLTPTLKQLAIIAPQLRSLLVNIGPLTNASARGVPALEAFLSDSVPLLTRLKPYLGGVIPVVDYINTYRKELAAFFANGTAADQATAPAAVGQKLLHYVRVSSPVNPETLTNYPHRLSTNRGNPYLAPGGYASLPAGLPVFGSYLCTSNAPPAIGPTISPALASVLSSVYYTADPSGPPCKAQGPLGAATTGQPQAFPQLKPLP